MPGLDWCPRPQLHTSFDARQWSGINVFDRGALNVVLGPYAAAGEGLFGDVVDALNGRRHVNDDLPADLAALWILAGGPGAPAFTVGIDSADRVFFQSNNQPFTVTDQTPGLGFTAATAAVGGGPWRATAPSDWTRGNTLARVTITPGAPGVPYVVPQLVVLRQSVPCLLRGFGPADADAVAAVTVEDQDSTAARWGIDADGRVWWSSTGAPPGAIAGPVWVDLDFRDRLGFTGNEVAEAVGGATVYRATRPCPGVLAPSRPLAEPLVRVSEIEASTARLLSGDSYRVEHSQSLGWLAQIWLDGPLDDGADLWAHYLRRWIPYQGDRVTLYQDADTRRRGEVTMGDGYGLLRTVELDGYRGRIVCRLAPDHGARAELAAQEGIYRRAPVAFRLQEVPGA